ncbi:Forkhead domain [Ceratobasidium sp. AG-Ba]|nr:Forkhead domain [Ceratobasidium sp. AG-Ba]
MSESDLCAPLSAAAPNDEDHTKHDNVDDKPAVAEGSEEARHGNENGSGNEAQSEEIAAYFKLESALFTYYCQTLVVTIGRRPPAPVRTGEASTGGGGAVGATDGEGPSPPSHEVLTLSAPSNPPPSEPAGPTTGGSAAVVDVDLGQLKSVSRLHARIEYDENESCFVLAVIGRNGAWVDGDWYGAGRRAPLTARSRIQIASRVFYFVLPDTASPPSPSPSSQCSNHSRSRSRTHSRSRSRTVSLVRTTTPPRQRSPSVDIMSSADSGDDTQWVEPEPEPQPVRGRTARKAPRGAGVAKGKGKGKEAEAEAAPVKGKAGKGKGKGKATSVSRDAKRKQPDPEPSTSKPTASKSTAGPSKSTTGAPKSTTAGLKTTPSHLPTPNSESEPAPVRPAITFATHCYHAIKALGGRATLADICQWMRDKYEWFTSAEGLATKWESSVRHNLSSNKAFVAHKRGEGEKGKGFYWTFDPACEASFLERERRARPMANPPTSAQAQVTLPAPAGDDGTDVSIDVEAEEDEVKGTGPPKRIDPSTIIDETKRRRAEKEERRRLKAEKRERRERREKERAMKAAKRLAATNPSAAAAVPGQPPHPFFFPPYGQPYPYPPFAPPQDGQDGTNPVPTFMVKGPDGQMVPMPIPPTYMVPGPDGQMVPMPMPPYMMGMPMPGAPGGGKDGKPEGTQAPPTFMVKGPDGQMVPAPSPMPGPYGFPPYGYPYYLPQGPYWMPYAPGEGKAGSSEGIGKEQIPLDPAIKQEDMGGGTLGHDEEKTVSPQPVPPWGMMPFPPPHSGMMSAPSPGVPGVPTPGMVAMSPPGAGPSGSSRGSGEVPPAAAQVPALTMAAPTPAPAPTSVILASAVAETTTPGPSLVETSAPAPHSISISPSAPVILTPVPPTSVCTTPAQPIATTTTPIHRTPTPVALSATSLASPAPIPTPTSSSVPPVATTPVPPAPAPAVGLSKLSIPIEVAPPPESYAPPAGGQASPYMILHEGKLWLSPEVFGSLSAERLDELRTLGAREVINKLQPDIVQYLRGKMRSGGRGRGRGRGRGGATSGITRPSASASPVPGGDVTAGAAALSSGAPVVAAESAAPSNTDVNVIAPSQGTSAVSVSIPTNAGGTASDPTSHGDLGSKSHGPSVDGLPGPSSVIVSLDEKTHGLVRPREEDEETAPEPKRPKPDAQTLTA